MTQGLGWLPDPKKLPTETPDWRFETYAATHLSGMTVAPSFHLKELVIDVLNQGGIGTCVWNMAMQSIRMRHVAQGISAAELGSRLMGYYLSRAAMHTLEYDSGTYPRTAFEMLNKFGFCPESLWPYSDINTGYETDPYRKMPSAKAFHDAFDQRSPTVYRRITSEGSQKLLDIKRANNAGFPVGFGVAVSKHFTRGDFNPREPLPVPAIGDIAGGHSMIFAGYSGDTHLVLNSYGSDFGVDGYVLFSPEYALETNDCWVIEHAPLEGEV